jgi:murein DD-endopeptidase MepM/ murein hydrolase activator NlpD
MILSGKVNTSMQHEQGSRGRALAARLSDKKVVAVSTILLFSLLFLFGSTSLSRKAFFPSRSPIVPAGKEAASGLPSAGGLRAQASTDDELVVNKSSEERVDRGLFFTAYRVARGDTLSGIAENFNVTLDTVVSFNGIKNARTLQPGGFLKIPSMSGILYTARAGDSVSSVAAANGVSGDRVLEVNGLLSDALETGRNIFLPDAKLASFTLREISGDLFAWPARGWISSWFGWRSDPFSGGRVFHNGVDIGVDTGTPVRAAMEGVVSETGYSSSYGNYILLYHHAGWMTLYGHLNSIAVKPGQRVAAGERIAYSGNTGYSTGPHLHFSVFKNGRALNPLNVLR